jgi:hypothetical protein
VCAVRIVVFTNAVVVTIVMQCFIETSAEMFRGDHVKSSESLTACDQADWQ